MKMNEGRIIKEAIRISPFNTKLMK